MRRLIAVAAAVVVLGSGCAARGLSFVQDDRVQDVRPRAGATVRLPLELTWSSDFDGRFGVFLDRAPMRPGRGLESLVPEDDPCRQEPTCPDAEWLSQRGVFVTDEPRLHLEVLPDRRKNNRSKDRHEAVIVLLDRDGVRVGESTFVTEFVVDRED
ncbi:MAG TPA: hypothetical protein VHF47_13800 [Acidimicrobiales bacterium]|nr:hypothetical protein [Acidimicrobiales bacterium]